MHHAASRYLRAYRGARAVDRGRSAVGGYVPAVAARHWARAGCAPCAGAVDDFLLSRWLRLGPDRLWTSLRPSWPQADIAGGACPLWRWRTRLRLCLLDRGAHHCPVL